MKKILIGYSFNFALLKNTLTTDTSPASIDDIKTIINNSEITVIESKQLDDVVKWLDDHGVDDYTIKSSNALPCCSEGDVFIKLCTKDAYSVHLMTVIPE